MVQYSCRFFVLRAPATGPDGGLRAGYGLMPMTDKSNTHHTHTHIYIYIHTYIHTYMFFQYIYIYIHVIFLLVFFFFGFFVFSSSDVLTKKKQASAIVPHML